MNDFEQDLRRAVRRDPAPPDFAAGVLARVANAEKQRVVALPFWRKPAAWALAAGLFAAALIPPAVLQYRRAQEARALEAKRELLIALQVTRAKLQQTKERIQRTTRHTL